MQTGHLMCTSDRKHLRAKRRIGCRPYPAKAGTSSYASTVHSNRGSPRLGDRERSNRCTLTPDTFSARQQTYEPLSIILRDIFVSGERYLYWYRISPRITAKSSQQRNTGRRTPWCGHHRNNSCTSPGFINWRRKRLFRHKEQSSQAAYSQRYSARQSVGTVRPRGHTPAQRVARRNK